MSFSKEKDLLSPLRAGTAPPMGGLLDGIQSQSRWFAGISPLGQGGVPISKHFHIEQGMLSGPTLFSGDCLSVCQ